MADQKDASGICKLCDGLGVRLVTDPVTGNSMAAGPCPHIVRERIEQRAAAALARADIPPLYSEAGWEGYHVIDGDTAMAKRFAKSTAENPIPPGRIIILEGRTGIGKTYLACAIALEQAKRFNLSVRYISWPEMMRRLMPEALTKNQQEKMRDDAREVDLLILDEIGVEKPSAFSMRNLYDLIDGRYKYLKPTIITTNENLFSWLGDQPGEAGDVGNRILSRLKEVGERLSWISEDYRVELGDRYRRSKLEGEVKAAGEDLGDEFAAALWNWIRAVNTAQPEMKVGKVTNSVQKLIGLADEVGLEATLNGITQVIGDSGPGNPLEVSRVKEAAQLWHDNLDGGDSK